MGSRGQSLKSGGFTAYNYKTLMRYNNTRFIVQKDFTKKNVKVPEMSNSKWAVYTTLNSDGNIKSISFFNGGRKKYKEIDFTHFHNGLKPHVHIIDPKAKNMRSGIARNLSAREKRRVDTIFRFHEKHNLQSKYQEEKKK